MQTPRREPQTEAQAQELKRFLEKGAATTVETRRTFAPTSLPDLVQGVALLPFEIDGEALAAELSSEDDELVLDLEVEGVTSSQERPVLVFAGQDVRSPAQAAEGDPAFVGALAFFVGAGGGAHHATTFRFRFRVTAAVRSQRTSTPFSFSLVQLPSSGRLGGRLGARLAVSSAELRLVRSVVGD